MKTNRNRPTHYTWYPYKGGATVTNIPGSFQSKMFQLNSVQLAQRMKRTISVIFGCKTKFASDVSDRRLNTDSSTAETWLTVHASGRCAPAGRHFFFFFCVPVLGTRAKPVNPQKKPKNVAWIFTAVCLLCNNQPWTSNYVRLN